MNKTPHSRYTIRFTDCDLFGHLNNGRYIDYLLNAREDHLKNEYGLDLTDFYKQGLSWLVAGHEISYIRPAAYNEQVNIKSALLKAEPGSLLVEMQMMDEQETHLKSLMWTKFIHVNVKSGRRENHTGTFMDFARSIEVSEVDTTKGYQHRLKQLIENIRSGRQTS
ncbi:MAG: acyl-CoA thioesterase [Ferruginibacter sp.]